MLRPLFRGSDHVNPSIPGTLWDCCRVPRSGTGQLSKCVCSESISRCFCQSQDTVASEGTIRMEYTTILHGLFYSFSSHYNNGISDETTKITMESSNIHVGDYENVPKISQTFTGSGTTTVIIQAISTSVENGYLFSLTKSGTNNIRYFVGTNDMIPVYIIPGSGVYNFADVTLNISGNGITLINWDGTYRPQTS